MTILIFFVVLFVLILVHEFGHFVTAKWTGMRVDEFGIGFPPKVFGKQFGETEYTFNALPIGGFVRIYGEDPTLVTDDPDRDRSFAAKNKLSQAIVLLAGVTMNVLFAWLLFVAIFMTGVPTVVEESVAGPDARLVVTSVLEGSPAEGVLTPGTEIIRAGTLQSEGRLLPSVFSEQVQATRGEVLALEIVSGNDTSSVTLVPEQNIVTDDPDRYAVGIALAMVDITQQSFVEAIVEATTFTITSLRDITVGIFTLITGSFTGTADFSQIAGPVGIVGLVGDAAEFGFTALLMFTAVISLNLAVINLLPFPALDGGRLVFVAIETVTRKPINPIWASRLNTIGFLLLMLLMIAVTWNDIARML
ncbi:MAG: site-2 protease family protein [Patescibacteria group bacterium]